MNLTNNQGPSKSKTIPIYSMKLAAYLMFKNFILQSISDNNIIKNRKVYFFVYSEDLQKTIDLYKQNKMKIIGSIEL